MLQRATLPALDDDEAAAIRLLLADRGSEIGDAALLDRLTKRRCIRRSADGFSVTILGHLSYLQAVTDRLLGA